jgi:hypothetical protein
MNLANEIIEDENENADLLKEDTIMTDKVEQNEEEINSSYISKRRHN